MEHAQEGPSNQTVNTNAEQTNDGIHCFQLGGTSSRHDFMNLNMGKVMNWWTVTVTPIADTVTAKVEEMTKKQDTTEVKFHKKDSTLNLPNAN